MDPLAQLVARVDAHLAKTGQNATNFGIAVMNNSALVPRLRSGNVTSKTMRRVVEYLERAEAKPRKRKAA